MGDDVSEWIARHDVARSLRGAGRMEDAESAAEYVLAVLARAIREADTGTDVVEIRVHQRAPDAHLIGREGSIQIPRAGRIPVLRVIARVDSAHLERMISSEPCQVVAHRKRRLSQIAECVLSLVADV